MLEDSCLRLCERVPLACVAEADVLSAYSKAECICSYETHRRYTALKYPSWILIASRFSRTPPKKREKKTKKLFSF